MGSNARITGTRPPSDDVRDRVRSLVERYGVRRAGLRLGLSDATVAKIAGGLPVLPAMATHARVRLDALAALAPVGASQAVGH